MKMLPMILLMICLCLLGLLSGAAQAESSYSSESIDALLEAYQKNYPSDPIVFQFTPDAAVFVTLPTNADRVLLYPNQDKISVQDRHAQAMDSSLIDNQTKAARMPIENQVSNQDITRSRLERMGL